MNCSVRARNQGGAVSDRQAEILNGCDPGIHRIHTFFSQESIVHEQSIEKNVDSSDLVIYHCNHPTTHKLSELHYDVAFDSRNRNFITPVESPLLGALG